MPNLRIAGIVGATMFWVVLALTGAITPNYSHTAQVVSALGAAGAPFWWLINLFGILPFAVATMLTGLFILRDFRPGALALASGAVLVVAGAGFSVAALFPCDVGCQPSTLLSARLHNLGAGTGFLLTPLASLLLGARLLSQGGSDDRGVYLFSILAGLGMFASFAVFLGILHPESSSPGMWQRMTIGFISIWIAGMSGILYRRAASRIDATIPAIAPERRLTTR